MKRLNLTFFMELGAALAPLAKVPNATLLGDADEQLGVDLIRARVPIQKLLQDETIPLAIPASRPAAQTLADLMERLRSKSTHSGSDAWEVYWAADPLLTLLHGELGVQSVYHIWPKRAYDTNLLIEKATVLFSKEIRDWFTDDETYNVEQAGKCIAFEVPTAAGFHLIRAAESVIRRYYAVVASKEPALKMRNWGAYIRNLKQCGAEPKVIHALEQIKDLHRNPVIHPEIALTIEEAVSLIGIIESIISAIYADMKQRANCAKPQNAMLPVMRRSGDGFAGILMATDVPDDETPF